MADQKKIDTKLLSQQLEKLIDITGDSCGPLLIKELQTRIDKTVDRFNKDLYKLIENSFKNHHDRIDFCKKIIADKKIIEKNKISIDREEVTSPEFIQLHEEKFEKKT